MLVLALVPGRARAQIDYRNLDDDRPLLTEDAYPIERHAFEVMLPIAFVRDREAGNLGVSLLELTYGLLDNMHVGVKAPVVVADPSGTAATDVGLSGVRVYALYNFNTEGPVLPAFAVRADVGVPVGSLAGDGARLILRAIATRSWGRTRVHLNAIRSFGGGDRLAVVEAGERWAYTAAVDRTLLRQSLILLTEVVASRAAEGAPVEVNAGLGIRYQWTPTFVLDVGIRRRLTEAGPDLGLILGFSHAFAWRSLMPSGGR